MYPLCFGQIMALVNAILLEYVLIFRCDIGHAPSINIEMLKMGKLLRLLT
jgi:hypothetical protein